MLGHLEPRLIYLRRFDVGCNPPSEDDLVGTGNFEKDTLRADWHRTGTCSGLEL